MRPVLSICIPTFNRCADLDRLLGSIVRYGSQQLATNEVEVVISDNASFDSTDAMVAKYSGQIPLLKYQKNSTNIGFAGNMNQAVSLGEAEYCWLMGSDEQVLPNAIQLVLNAIWDNPDVILGNPITNGVERKYLRQRGKGNFYITNYEDFYAYISKCTEISAAFAFISTVVVRKTFWNLPRCPEEELTHPYTHMLRISRAISSTTADILYLDQPVVITSFNINEFNKTLLPHFELDLLTIKYISEVIFKGSNNLLSAYGSLFKSQYGDISAIKARVESSSVRWAKLSPALELFGYKKRILEKKFYDPLLFQLYMLSKRAKALLALR